MELKGRPETRFWLIFAVLSIASAMLVIHIASTPEERARAGDSSQLRADYSRDPIVPDDQLIAPIDPAVIGDTARDLGVDAVETVALLPPPSPIHSEQTAAMPGTPTQPATLAATTVLGRTPTSATTALPTATQTATQVLATPDEATPTVDEGTQITPDSGNTQATVVASSTAEVAASSTLLPATATPTSTPTPTATATSTATVTPLPTPTPTVTVTPTRPHGLQPRLPTVLPHLPTTVPILPTLLP